MNVYFRVDSSNEIGGGHLYRCISLAEALLALKVNVLFICKELPGNFIQVLIKKNFNVIRLSNEMQKKEKNSLDEIQDAKDTLRAIEDKEPDWIVLDHYELGFEWEFLLKQHVKKLMSIDDYRDRKHFCDVLLNQNYIGEFKRNPENLGKLVPRMLTGLSYALLNNEFIQLRRSIATYKNSAKNVLVFFTLGDDQGETLKALEAIKIFIKQKNTSHAVTVVVGQSTKYIAEITKICCEFNWKLFNKVESMAALINEADLGVGAAGASSWERCALGVPAIVTVLAENQKDIAESLECNGVALNLGWYSKVLVEDYVNALEKLDSRAIQSMSKRALGLIDAEGAQRVAREFF